MDESTLKKTLRGYIATEVLRQEPLRFMVLRCLVILGTVLVVIGAGLVVPTDSTSPVSWFPFALVALLAILYFVNGMSRIAKHSRLWLDKRVEERFEEIWQAVSRERRKQHLLTRDDLLARVKTASQVKRMHAYPGEE